SLPSRGPAAPGCDPRRRVRPARPRRRPGPREGRPRRGRRGPPRRGRDWGAGLPPLSDAPAPRPRSADRTRTGRGGRGRSAGVPKGSAGSGTTTNSRGGALMAGFKRDVIAFHYLDVGQGTPFVFQHGLGGDVRQPAGLFRPPQGVRLLCLDARAHGRTEPLGSPSALTFDVFGDDLVAWLDYLGVGRAVLGGISMGAGVALNVAVRYPERVA